MSIRVLVNDDEAPIVQALATLLKRQGYEVHATRNCEDALVLLQNEKFDVLISDVIMKPMSGLELLQEVRATIPDLTVIMITGIASIPNILEAMRLKVFDLITKPFKIQDLVETVDRAIMYRDSRRHLSSTQTSTVSIQYHFGVLLGESQVMHALYRMIAHVSEHEDAAFITGEPGCERELTAKAIHRCSGRRDAPIHKLVLKGKNRAAIEQELFGGGLGKDLVARTAGGTLIFDPIEALPPALAYRLVSLIRHYRESSTLKLPFFVFLSHLKYDEALSQGKLDRGLTDELKPESMSIPPLRDRREDIVLIAQGLAAQISRKTGQRVMYQPLSTAAMQTYSWPGNLSEMIRVIREAVAKSDSAEIALEHLPSAITTNLDPSATTETPGTESLKWQGIWKYLDTNLNEWPKAALEKCDGDTGRAADLVGMAEPDFLMVLQQLDTDS